MSTTITVRRIQRHPGPQTPKYWFGNRAFETHFFNALSSTFPEGERFFIQSVRAYQHCARDPELKAAVKAFVGQEGQHSREHDNHMDLLESQGYSGLVAMNNTMRKVMRWFLARLPRHSLALTTAIEHVTANLADNLMTHPDRWLMPMSEDMRLLWHWHAVEEAEHKAVAFDVFIASGGSHADRVLAMLHVTMGLFLEVFVRHTYLLAKDGLLFNLAEWRRGVRFLWGREGLLRAMLRSHWAYFRRDFHPSQVDNRAKIESFIDAHQRDFVVAE